MSLDMSPGLWRMCENEFKKNYILLNESTLNGAGSYSLHTRKKLSAEAIQKLKFFILAAQTSQLKEFEPCLTMLGNWSKYILNSFECKYTNGYTEGTNNAIKIIKRNAFGYRNFNNFRNRIFLFLT